MGKRSLKNLCFDYLSELKENKILAQMHFDDSTNMTDELVGLKCLHYGYENTEVLNTFYDKWNKETLVIQKWFALQAANPNIKIDKLRELEARDCFDIKVPNLARSLFSTFMRSNLIVAFSDEGIDYSCSKVLEIDGFNSQIAAGLAKSYSIVTKLPNSNREYLLKSLDALLKKNISSDLSEVLKNIIG
jgi:aminopeptidase N